MVSSETRNPLTELRRGVLAFCVLAALRREESYAFDIVRTMSGTDLLTSEGTIYPLLARMRQQEWVTTDWRESAEGPPRRYYAVTARGLRALEEFSKDWSRFSHAVDALLAPGAHAPARTAEGGTRRDARPAGR
jgi:PadR family transcriptional regulator PadR